METLYKINLKCEARRDFAKDTCEWIKEMRTKYAGITDNEKMILEIVEERLERIAKTYSKNEAVAYSLCQPPYFIEC